ncbi:MAG: baseplate J/gp47 family protein [Pseudomonadota bacterium]
MSLPVDKSLDDVRTEMFQQIESVQEEYAAKGWLPRRLNLNKGIVRGLIEIWSWGLYQVYSFLAFVLKQASAETATDLWLDWHCAQVELTRKPASKAAGTVIFSRAGTVGNVPIPAGRIVKTRPDGAGMVYRFVTTASVVMADGNIEISVPVIAEEYGMASNVTAGQISEIATVIDGIDSVTNDVSWLTSEGTDRETDDSLRNRYRLKWKEGSGVTKYAYESWALTVTGVESVTILDQHPRGQGTVDVVIQGSAGVPTQELIDNVTDAISELYPINDDYLVRSPYTEEVHISAELVLRSGIPEDIIAAAENRIRALFEAVSTIPDVIRLQIGEDLTMDRLIATIMAVPGVKKINWTYPTFDMESQTDWLFVLYSIELTYVWDA